MAKQYLIVYYGLQHRGPGALSGMHAAGVKTGPALRNADLLRSVFKSLGYPAYNKCRGNRMQFCAAAMDEAGLAYIQEHIADIGALVALETFARAYNGPDKAARVVQIAEALRCELIDNRGPKTRDAAWTEQVTADISKLIDSIESNEL